MKKAKNYDKVLQFKIILNDSQPLIWRRILVPADYTFFALHCAIQGAMGWTDSHLHAFYIGERKGRHKITIEFPYPENYDVRPRDKARDERRERLSDYFGKTVKQCAYLYDFDENWKHTVLFERELPRAAAVAYPFCLAGKNASPPENCGGLDGYEYLREIIKNPDHEEFAELTEWLCLEDPERFDPLEFNPGKVEFENPEQRLKDWNTGFGAV
ncbi:MAG: plasmid pRiA4b ORF-3 family protein [bacterium]|nr:plasmid pRiA4b ORF-3 family protein [bacterium]